MVRHISGFHVQIRIGGILRDDILLHRISSSFYLSTQHTVRTTARGTRGCCVDDLVFILSALNVLQRETESS